MKHTTITCDMCGKQITEPHGIENYFQASLHFSIKHGQHGHTTISKCDKEDLCPDCATIIAKKLETWITKDIR